MMKDIITIIEAVMLIAILGLAVVLAMAVPEDGDKDYWTLLIGTKGAAAIIFYAFYRFITNNKREDEATERQ